MPVPRVRFCPAPSGWLHVGSARTALYNWLRARGAGGTFVFRIEDTDAERATDESMRGMMASMRWLGLEWDEGPEVEGPYGPYQQSQRGELYAAVSHALLQAGALYDAYETAEELAAERDAALREGRPPGYGGGHRDLTGEQRDAFLAQGRRPALRVRTPDEGTVSFDDAVRGTIEFDWKDIPDFIIQREDGTHTYFLANAVDDLAMGINFIARGEDLLSATPRQLLLYDLILRDGLLDRVLADNALPARPEDAVVPTFAHLPLMVGEDRKKLSKRHGSVSIDEYRRQGFLPEVLVNFLALCGWSYDATTEKMTVDELVERFSFDRVGRTPAFFDPAKLRSMNGDRIKELADGDLAERLQPYFADEGLVADTLTAAEQRLLLGLAPLLRERIQTLAEAVPLAAPYFRDEVVWDDKSVAKNFKGRAGEVLQAAVDVLADVDWDGDTIESTLRALADRLELGLGKVMQPIRVAVAGTSISTPLPQTLALLDRGLVLRRLAEAQEKVPA
jgi:glutamyl-tRNA synthetase